MKKSFTFWLFIFAFVFIGCSRNGGKDKNSFPQNFNSLSDEEKVDFMIQQYSPDSVARFICQASLGNLSYANIEDLGVATNYAFEHFKGDALDQFSNTYDSYVSSLPLADKMKIYALAGTEDPQGLGLRLGLEYLQSIREKNLSPQQVEEELKAFKVACSNDKETYDRFLIGFKTVLKADKGKDMPKGVYERFVNYN